MQKLILGLSILFIVFGLKSQGQVKNTTNYTSYFSKQDIIFDSLPNNWEEGAFLGNGLLGVMVYGEDANSIRFDLGRTDVVDHLEGVNPSIGRARMPIGKFLLSTSGAIKKINLRLDLYNAELNGTITTDKGTIQFQGLIAAGQDVIIFNTSSEKNEKLFSWEWRSEKAISPFLTLGRDDTLKYKANPPFKTIKEDNINYNYQALLAGGSYTTAWKEIQNNNRHTLLITIANTYPVDESKMQAAKVLNSVKLESLPEIISDHRAHWNRFYEKSFISLPDRRLESFWWIQQYKMASATRVGAYPIDLMGPWYRITPWPKYWWNLNAQLTYYPFFSSNHIELVKPFMKMINDNLDNLIKNAPEPYQYNSAALARSGPYTMTSGIRVLKGNDGSSASASSMELGNLTWLLHVYWQAYEYTMDKEVMSNIYPVLKRAINYYLNIMDKEKDGKYHLPYTYSPEYPKGITRDANYDLSSLRWGAKTLLYINEQLHLKDPLVPGWKDVLQNLTPYPQDEKGYRIGRDADFSISHRHYSHLLQIYPYYDINWDQMENRDLITRSLEQWEKDDSAWRGYSYTGSGSIYAMMGNGNKTHQLLNKMMVGRFAIKPNTMYLEAGPVIETPLSAVTTINEMLIQSWNGTIRVFPAVPDAWKEASFDNLRAKGAFLVSAVRKNGRTEFIRIKSLAGSACLIKSDLTTNAVAKGNRKFSLTHKGNGVIAIDLRKGEEVILHQSDYTGNFVIQPVGSKDEINTWGLLRVPSTNN